jgi:hypothetical protein
LLVPRRVITRGSWASILEESDPAEAGLAIALFLATGVLGATALVVATGVLGATALVVATAALPLAVGLSVAVGLLWLTARLLLLGIGLALFAVAPALVVALNEAALGLDHPEVVVGVLPIRLGCDAIARGRGFTRQRLILIEDLMGIASHADVGPAGVKDLVSIGRTVGVVVVLLVVAAAATAATIATAARPLTIV